MIPRLSLLALEDRCTPSGVPSTWTVRGSGGGGALFSPSYNPANANEITIASDMSQVFRTQNAGDSWKTIDFRELQGGHQSKIHFTDNPNIQYSIDHDNDAMTPTKSTDCGVNWTPIASDPTDGGAFYLQADPTNSNRLIVTDYTRLYYSGDGGGTWTLKYTTPNSGGGLVLGGAFWDGNTITLGTSDGLITSINSGGSFALQSIPGIAAGQNMVSFAGGKSGSTTRFVAVTMPSADVYAGVPGYDNGGGGQVYTITQGAASWTSQTLPAGTWPFFAGMARNNPDVMYVAGGGSGGAPTVIKSVSGGAWSNVLLTTNNQNVATGWSGQGGDRSWGYGELAIGFAVDPLNANRAVITDYGFAHSTDDGGGSWKALYVNPADRNPAGANITAGKAYRDSGLDNTTSWQVAWAGQNVILANSDIRGQISKDGGQTFGFGYTGHTANSLYRVARTADGTLYAGTGTRHDLYQSTTLSDSLINGAAGDIIRSTDNGLTWTTMKVFNDVVAWVAADPTNSNRLYASVVNSSASVGGVYVTNNLSDGSGATWTKLANPPRTEGHPFNIVVLNDGSVVASYSGRRNSSGAFTASSGVFYLPAGSSTWIDRSASGMQYWTKDVVVDPFDSTQNTWYAGVFSGWGGAPNGLGGLYKSTDRGQTWTRILTLDRVTSCTFNAFDQNELFLTTEGDGLWYSSNIRSGTPTFSSVASYPFRQPERVFFNPSNANEIWVTSFGGGVMVGTNAPQAPTTVVNNNAAQRSRVTSLTVNFPSPIDAGTLTGVGAVTLTRADNTVVRTGATGANGKITVAPMSGMVTSITLTFSNANGDAVSAGVENGSLSDGVWTLTIPSQSYTAPVIKRLFGDANGDGTVDANDMALFGNAFGGTGVNSPFDINGDSTVDANDMAQFGNRFGRTL